MFSDDPSARQPPDAKRRALWLLPVIVFLCGVVLTAVFHVSAHAVIRERDFTRFNNAVRVSDATIKNRLEIYIGLLRAGAGLFAAQQEINHESFRRFEERINPEQNYPGVQAIAFAERVEHPNKEKFTAAMRASGHADFAITPEGNRPEYFPIILIEPMDRRNRRALGYDMFSEPVRREAMERARDAGGPRASGRVTLVQEIDANKQAGFLIYVPVFRGTDAPTTIAERRERLLGFVYSPFRMHDLLEGIFGVETQPDVHFEIFDGPGTDETRLMYRLPVPSSEVPAHVSTVQLDVAGRSWTIVYRSTPSFDAASARAWTKWVSTAGIVVSALISGIISALVRAEAKSHRRSREVEVAAERFRFLAESMPPKIFTATPDGTFDYFNEQWTHYLGIPSSQLKEQGWIESVHADDQPDCRREWQDAIRTGNTFVCESRLRRHDGVYRWHAIGAHALRDAEGVQIWIGSATDIDDSKRQEERLEKTVVERTAELRETNSQLEAFVYTIAHDLRAPLRSISGYSYLLEQDNAVVLDEDGRTRLRKIQAAAGLMDRLILDLIAFGRTARAEMELGAVDVGKAWDTAMAQTATLREESKAIVEVDGPLLPVIGHEATLAQAFANLLSNALKFVAPGVAPRVRMHCEDRGRTIRIWVEDNGIGIPASLQERAFRLFERLNGAQYGGTGIGLTIVRKGVERMGGAVGVVSERDAGSRFWIELKKP